MTNRLNQFRSVSVLYIRLTAHASSCCVPDVSLQAPRALLRVELPDGVTARDEVRDPSRDLAREQWAVGNRGICVYVHVHA
jgi:hypothetical protein